jgi:hypothetical protein
VNRSAGDWIRRLWAKTGRTGGQTGANQEPTFGRPISDRHVTPGGRAGSMPCTPRGGICALGSRPTRAGRVARRGHRSRARTSHGGAAAPFGQLPRGPGAGPGACGTRRGAACSQLLPASWWRLKPSRAGVIRWTRRRRHANVSVTSALYIILSFCILIIRAPMHKNNMSISIVLTNPSQWCSSNWHKMLFATMPYFIL